MGDLRLTAVDLERERPGLLGEVENMFGAIPTLGAQNHARELIRPTPRGGRRGGLPEQVRRLTVEDVRGYWKRLYKPRNAVLILAGALEPDAARRMVAGHFSTIEPGEPAPTPGEPAGPKFGSIAKKTVASIVPNARPMACLAYQAPQPNSPLYAPFLVLASRFWAGAPKLGGARGAFPVYFTPLDDGAVVALSVPATAGQQQAFARLEAFVDETTAPELGGAEIFTTSQQMGFILGLAEPPDPILAQNPYGVAFSLGRREQLGLDAVRLKGALQAVTDRDLRRVASTVFAPARHAGAFIEPAN